MLLKTFLRVKLFKPTWEPTAGKVTPCSRRFLIIAEMRLSWGSLRKSSAHSTIRAFSFSHTLGCPWVHAPNKYYTLWEAEASWNTENIVVVFSNKQWNFNWNKQQKTDTLFKTLLTSLANSLEQTSRWNIFPQFETQAPRSCENIGTNTSSESLLRQKKHTNTQHTLIKKTQIQLSKFLVEQSKQQQMFYWPYSQCLHGHMRVLVVHSSHYRPETFFRPTAERGFNSKMGQQQNHHDNKCILISTNRAIAILSFLNLNPGTSLLTTHTLSLINMLLCQAQCRLEAVNSPRAGLPYLITYVQDEAPVLSCIHLTGCFLCRKEITTINISFAEAHFQASFNLWTEKPPKKIKRSLV